MATLNLGETIPLNAVNDIERLGILLESVGERTHKAEAVTETVNTC